MQRNGFRREWRLDDRNVDNRDILERSAGYGNKDVHAHNIQKGGAVLSFASEKVEAVESSDAIVGARIQQKTGTLGEKCSIGRGFHLESCPGNCSVSTAWNAVRIIMTILFVEWQMTM